MMHFVTLVGIFLIALFVRKILIVIFKKYSIPASFVQKYPVRDNLAWLFRNREVRNKLLITLGFLLFLQLLVFIPLPGVDVSKLSVFINKTFSQNQLLATNFSAGSLRRLSIGALGVMPFISACLLLQLASAIFPFLRRLTFMSEAGREKMLKYTYVLTVILALLQAYYLSVWLGNPMNFRGIPLVANPGLIFSITTMLSLTASVMLILFIANMINKHGLGNGIPAMVVFSFLFWIAPSIIRQIILLASSQQIMPSLLVVIGALFVGVVYVIFFVTRITKNIEIENKKAGKTSIVFRPTIVARVPLAWRQQLLLFQ